MLFILVLDTVHVSRVLTGGGEDILERVSSYFGNLASDKGDHTWLCDFAAKRNRRHTMVSKKGVNTSKIQEGRPYKGPSVSKSRRLRGIILMTFSFSTSVLENVIEPVNPK